MYYVYIHVKRTLLKYMLPSNHNHYFSLNFDGFSIAVPWEYPHSRPLGRRIREEGSPSAKHPFHIVIVLYWGSVIPYHNILASYVVNRSIAFPSSSTMENTRVQQRNRTISCGGQPINLCDDQYDPSNNYPTSNQRSPRHSELPILEDEGLGDQASIDLEMLVIEGGFAGGGPSTTAHKKSFKEMMQISL